MGRFLFCSHLRKVKPQWKPQYIFMCFVAQCVKIIQNWLIFENYPKLAHIWKNIQKFLTFENFPKIAHIWKNIQNGLLLKKPKIAHIWKSIQKLLIFENIPKIAHIWKFIQKLLTFIYWTKNCSHLKIEPKIAHIWTLSKNCSHLIFPKIILKIWKIPNIWILSVWEMRLFKGIFPLCFTTADAPFFGKNHN